MVSNLVLNNKACVIVCAMCVHPLKMHCYPTICDLSAVLRIRSRIRMFLGLLNPDPDPLVRGMDPDPYPSIIKQK
jgi:hypothetical protein